MFGKLLNSKILVQFLKFCAVGVTGTAIDFGVLNLGVAVIKLNVYVAAALAFILAATNNFLLNKRWTFSQKSTGQRMIGQYAQYLAVSAGGLILNLSIMYALIEAADWWYNWAKVLATALVIVWNFSMNKYWTFRPSRVKVDIDKIEISN
ncbi:MAG: GtrA family protein [Patescibacteria group bacterium]